MAYKDIFKYGLPGDEITCNHTASQIIRDLHQGAVFPIVGKNYTLRKKFMYKGSPSVLLNEITNKDNQGEDLPLPAEWFGY